MFGAMRSHVAAELGREAAIEKEKRKAAEARAAAKSGGRGKKATPVVGGGRERG